jgi:hypothetical protein
VSEQCSNCGKQKGKYMTIDITQFHDINEDPEATEHLDSILCIDCWNHIKENSSILQIILSQ